MRGATGSHAQKRVCPAISIHAPHARSDNGLRDSHDLLFVISIHAPHARSDDSSSKSYVAAARHFNPRSSCEERRQSSGRTSRLSANFNPRSSCEERLMLAAPSNWPMIFQSTLLMRGATVSLSSIDLLDFIIHFSRTQHLFPKTLLLTLCPVSSISCVMALRA